MGHLINPISTRLGFNSFWLSSWSRFKPVNYSYNLMLDTVLRNLIFWLFSDSIASAQLSIVGFFFSHFKVIRRNNKILIFIFLFLDSSKVLKSQSVEVDPSAVEISSNLLSINNSNSSLLTKINFYAMSSFFGRLFLQNKNNQLLNNIHLTNLTFNSFIKDILSFSFTKLFNFNSHFSFFKPILFINFLDDIDCIKSSFISRFFARRLSFGFDLNRVIFPIVLDLSELIESGQSSLKGFRISCSGRFTKTQMASYSWEKFGPVPLNNFNCSVDYALSQVCMKYGMCGIKVWLFSEHKPFRSFRLNSNRHFFNSKVSDLYSFNKKLNLKQIFLFFFKLILLRKLAFFVSNPATYSLCSKNLEFFNKFLLSLFDYTSSKYK